jgi:beta-N-acetylhexosaminidase
MKGQGIASCGKHFPGYSAATSDAHYELPRINRTREELDRNEFAVFREFVGGAQPPGAPTNSVDSMMICHGWYPCFEPQRTPATLSQRVVTDLLRNEMGFEGLIMTDDLDMGAILNGYRLEDAIRLTVAAGNDLAMICHRIPEIVNVHRVLSTLPHAQNDRALESVARFKKNITPPDQFSEAAFRKIDNEIWDLRVAVLGEERAKQRSAEDGKRSPVEMF